jgi:hypothetical protein
VHAGAAFGCGVAFHGSTLFAEAGYPGFKGGFAVAGFFKQAGNAVEYVAVCISVYAATRITQVITLKLPLSQIT